MPLGGILTDRALLPFFTPLTVLLKVTCMGRRSVSNFNIYYIYIYIYIAIKSYMPSLEVTFRGMFCKIAPSKESISTR